MTERLFFIDSISSEGVLPINSHLIHNTDSTLNVKKCYTCGVPKDLELPYFLVDGFDDFVIDDSIPLFMPKGPPLITTSKWSKVILEYLKGAKSIDVGFKEWNQIALPESEYFSKEPKLKAIVPTTHFGGLYEKNNNPPNRCNACGSITSFQFLSCKRKESSFVKKNDLPEDEIVLLDGSYLSNGFLISETGVLKLKNIGFTNITLSEIEVR